MFTLCVPSNFEIVKSTLQQKKVEKRWFKKRG